MFVKKKKEKEDKVKKIMHPGQQAKNRKWIASVVCVIAAAALAFGVLPMMYTKEAKTQDVITMVKMVPKGHMITKGDIQEKKVGAYGLPADIISSSKMVVGNAAAIDLLPGDILMQNKIGNSDPVTDSILSKGKELVSVTLKSTASGVANHLSAGDVVNVFVASNNNQEITINSDPELQNIPIYALENADAVNLNHTQKNTDTDQSAQVAQTATLIVTPAQASKLVTAEYTGTIHMVLVKRGE